MLKKRIIANLIVKDGVVVQSINFKRFLPVGKPSIAIEFLNKWGIDEIVFLDISASRKKKSPDFEMVKKAALKCLVPLTVGGGVLNIDHVKELMHSGADKISLNQAAIHNPQLISDIAHMFGNQCVVISIDTVKDVDGVYRVYDYLSRKMTQFRVPEFLKKMELHGAGEILVNSVERDGSYQGYDLDLIKEVCKCVKVPVICAGGAKNAQDFVTVFSHTTASAAAAGNFFHFTEHSVNTTKANIMKYVDVRLETHANYRDSEFNNELRLLKKDDGVLENMLYLKIEKETI